jgi:hypothetical protein
VGQEVGDVPSVALDRFGPLAVLGQELGETLHNRIALHAYQLLV